MFRLKMLILSLILVFIIPSNTDYSFAQNLEPKPTIQIFVFHMENCYWCDILENKILNSSEVEEKLKDIEVIRLSKEKIPTKVLKTWKISIYPTVFAVNRTDQKTAKILDRWQLKAGDNKNYDMNKKRFLQFLQKYTSKKLDKLRE